MNSDLNEKGCGIEVEAKRISDDIVDKLLIYRKRMQMTQQDVADATGIKRANIARIESKKHAASFESLLKYAECLNLDISIEVKERQA